MSLQKQGIDFAFGQGVDTKTNPKKVKLGKFLRLENVVFNKGELLQKRNGFKQLASLPDKSYAYLTTLNGNLTAIGTSIAAYNRTASSWVKKGNIQPMKLGTLPVIRNNLNQTAVDCRVADNGAMCVAYLETDGTTTTNKFAVLDSLTGQNIIAPTAIPVASGTVSGGMRVFILGNKFVICFTNTISGTAHLQYITIGIYSPLVTTANTDIAAAYAPVGNLSWDAVAVGPNLYFAYNNTAGGQSIKATYLTSGLSLATPITFNNRTGSQISLTAALDGFNDNQTYIYVTWWSSADGLRYGYMDTNMNVLQPVLTLDIAVTGVANVTSVAAAGTLTAYAEITNAYGYDSGVPTNYIKSYASTFGGVATIAFVIRSMGLASKAFIFNGTTYFLAAYQSPYQPTYFLVNASKSLQATPVIAAKLAYENGGGYLTKGLPGVSLANGAVYIPYLFKDLIQAVNKNTNVPAGSQVAGIYSQTGINLANFIIGTAGLDTAEIGNDLHISGGFLWMYDGYLPVEHSFFLFPDSVEVATSGTGGVLAAQQYYYQVAYEWTDNQGNAFRSAPSIPVAITTTGSTSSNTLQIPTLRATMKTANPVKIVIYRWSTGLQNYFQVTSITQPVQNNTAIDYITFVDTLADASILGNNLIYTTGGVLETVNAPGTNIMTLFDDRLWLVDAEDQNLLWFSKQVIEATPAEMSDLLTVYVAPTTGAQSSTGPITALSVMDDKLIIAKRNAFYYINGTGPDNTGSNSQFSQPIFITSTIGCTNQNSIVFQPKGLMFQSDKGIWLLGRDLSTEYIGADVEDYTLAATVIAAVNIPETNQVRFTLDSGITLMYDYYFGQWSVFKGIPGLSSSIYQDLHTYINAFGAVFQESPGSYLDGTNPVLMALKTGPLRLDKLQSYQRAYFFYILGDYVSPHKLYVSMTYDYDQAPSQSVLITPNNYSTPYGSGLSQSPYGQQDPYGGPVSLENWRVFLERQRCMAFNITIEEQFDPQFTAVAGAGLTMSGINVVCGFKKGYRPQPSATSIG